MNAKNLGSQAKSAALKNGADLVGIVAVEDLPEHGDRIERMLPEAKTVLVIASAHSLGSLLCLTVINIEFVNHGGKCSIIAQCTDSF